MNDNIATDTSEHTIAVGHPAPDFTLATDQGTFTLSDHKGKQVILFFYPKDNTSGCTKEAIGFSEHLSSFADKGAVVVGLSPDSIKSHANFRAKHSLTVILASDTEKTVLSTYDAWKEKSMYGKKYMGVERSTFLIDEQGNFKNIWRKVKVPGHVEEVLKAL
ncbi:MAG: peroxiredoxin [Alphaproteobacteria bacterium]